MTNVLFRQPHDLEITPIQYLHGKERKPEEIFSFIEKKTNLFLSGH